MICWNIDECYYPGPSIHARDWAHGGSPLTGNITISSPAKEQDWEIGEWIWLVTEQKYGVVIENGFRYGTYKTVIEVIEDVPR